jgi:hypothetical protein
MRSLSVRLLLSFLVLIIGPTAFAHDVTLSGTTSFASLDGSSSDHDGSLNGVFTVNDGNLIVNGVVNCNDDSTASACAMAFNVSGNMSVNTGGALYAENRSGSGIGGAITLTVGGNLALNGNAIISTASKSSSGSTGGAITANVAGSVSLSSGTTIDAGASNAKGGAIAIAAGGTVSVDGNVLSGPSRTFLATRLSGGAALDGGTGNSGGGAITIGSTTFAGPAVIVGTTANIVSQGSDSGAGPVTLDGCGIEIRGLVAALSRKDSAANVRIRSGKGVVVDGRDLGGSGTRMGRVRADAPSGTALNKGVDIFATETIDIYGPSGSLFVITALPGLHDSKSYGGLIRIMSVAAGVNASGNVIDAGHTASGDSGGTVEISAKEDVNLNTAVIRAVGDFNTNNPNRGGGSIRVRSYSGDVIWTNGTGEVRPVGSSSNLPLADQGSIVLTACGTVNTTGSSFPVVGTATSVFPETHTGVCSPAAPSLPSGVPPLIVCNTPPVANDVNAATNEDNTVTITLSGSDADGDPLTFSIVSGPSNGSLGPIVPTGPTTATVNYTPNLNFNGVDSFVYQANDGNGGTDNATVTIAVAPVNDPPSFLAGPSVTVLEDSGAQTYTNWAMSISAGPADESGQTVTFTVTASNPSLFSVQPAVSSTGTLTFTPAANAHGTSSISITAQDNGGTANGGNDTSAPQSSSITITAVNDEPSFTAGGDVTVNEDSGAYSATWATAISVGPNEPGQTVTFFTSNDNNALFSTQPAISSSGMLTFTPAANANGLATVSVYAQDNGGTANGGDDTSATQTFKIYVTAVNDEPSFTSGGDVTVLEDSGAYSAAWATGISAGPADESGQTRTFFTSNNNNALFSVQPSISSTGVLTFTTAPNAFGPALVTVYLQDNGGTANGGDDTSATVQFTINVNGVNDEPSFTSGGDVTVNEDSGVYSAPWASAISAGPNESGQALTFFTSNGNNALFSVQPSISSTGVLTFTPAPNAFGFATVSVYLMDNGGTANGGDDTSGIVTFKITVNAVNDAPTAVADSWETEGNTELRVDLVVGITPYVADTTPSGKGVADNDFDPEGDPITITGVVGCADAIAPYDCAVTGGTVSLNANGSFAFQPSPGATSGSFQYTVTDGAASANGSVSITIHDMIWYVNGSAAGGDGTSASPFNNFASLNGIGGSGDVDGTGDYIFVHTSSVSGSLALEASQKLWGQGVGLIIPRNLNGNGSPTVLVPAGAAATITAVFGDVITIDNVTSTEVAGLILSTTTGNGIRITSSGAGGASSSIYSNSITAGSGKGIDVAAGGLGGTTVNVDDTTALAMGNGVQFIATAGTVAFSYTDGSVTSLGSNGILFETRNSSAASAVTVSGTTFSSNSSQALVIQAANSSTITMATVSANTFANNGLGINVTQAHSSNVTFKILNNTPILGSQLHGINVFSSSTSTGGTLTGRIQGNHVGDANVAGSGSAFGNGIRVVIQGQTRGIVLIDSNVVRQTPFGRGIEVTGQSSPGLDVTITNNDVNPQDATGFPSAAIFVTSDNLGSGGLVRADIRNNTVPAANDTYDYPNFDGTGAYLVFEEFGGATSELVDTPPASANASAQLASTNTGSTYANAGVSLIAGPIMTPP